MDPGSAAVILGKLIAVGLSVNKAVGSDGFDESDLKALQSMLDSGAGIWKSLNGVEEAKPAALHLAMVARAFGQALTRHWGGGSLMVPQPTKLPDRVAKWRNKEEHQRRKEIEARTKVAALSMAEPGNLPVGPDELALLGSLTGEPQNTPYYRALWRAFSNPELAEDDEETPLLLADGVSHEFARHFRLAYAEELATPVGQRVNAWLGELVKTQPDLTRYILAQSIAGWGSRHVFGNVHKQAQNDEMPFMALEDFYVEPLATAKGQEDSQLVLELLQTLLETHELVVVQADFGQGKTLTARTLAQRLAAEFSKSPEVGLDVTYPIVIKCTRDIHGTYEHKEAVRNALWETAKDAQWTSAPRDFEGFGIPPSEQRVLYILDGLDELALSPTSLEALFRRLREATHANHRAFVFTRPGALSRNCLPKDTPVIELQKFDEPRIAKWLRAWCQLPGQKSIGVEQLQGDFKDLAATPILLLMIAMTWDPDQGGQASQASLYESFFSHIARGKHKGDSDEHKLVQRASAELLVRLRADGEVKQDEDDPVEAMLWMMSRVAWEAHVLAQEFAPRELQRWNIQGLISRLNLGSELEALVLVGVLVALQHSQDADTTNILFGHKSFREFLVARYWKSQLARVARHRDELTKELRRARLLQPEDRAFSFLQEMLQDIDVSQIALVRNWAESEFNDQSLSSTKLHEDERHRLRESALAIGSTLPDDQGDQGIRVLSPLTIRSMWLCFEMRYQAPRVFAPRLQYPDAMLRRTNIIGAVLFNADLRRADLAFAVLTAADLSGADLSEALLFGADLSLVQLSEANLREANLRKADLTQAALLDADLRGAALTHAILCYADLRGAKLNSADLDHADIRHANLMQADLSGATFVGANFQFANLSGANLSGADFRDADLSRANLVEANFSDADLRGAKGVPSNKRK